MDTYEPYQEGESGAEDEDTEELPEPYLWVSGLIFCAALAMAGILISLAVMAICAYFGVRVPPYVFYGNLIITGIYGLAFRLTLLYNS